MGISILISGAQRCGKTILARKISDKLSVPFVRTDDLRKKYFPAEIKHSHRVHLAHRSIVHELEKNSKGVVIEGAAILNLLREKIEIQAYDAIFIAIGFTGCIDEKRNGIISFRKNFNCWTKNRKFSDQDINNLAERELKESIKQKKYCSMQNLPFYEIRPNQFYADINAVRDEIIMKLQLSSVKSDLASMNS